MRFDVDVRINIAFFYNRTNFHKPLLWGHILRSQPNRAPAAYQPCRFITLKSSPPGPYFSHERRNCNGLRRARKAVPLPRWHEKQAPDVPPTSGATFLHHAFLCDTQSL